MSTLLAKDYSYNYMSFTGSNGIYTLQATECEEDDKIQNCIDTFKDEKGNFIRVRREVIMSKQKKKEIAPVPESIVKIVTMDSKEWNKRKVRSV